MKLGRERRFSKAAAVGLAVAAIGAPGAAATTIPYLSHGQGISEAQMAQLQNITPSADSQYNVYGGWSEYVAQDNSANGTSIAVAGKYLNSGHETNAAGSALGAFGNPVGTAPATSLIEPDRSLISGLSETSSSDAVIAPDDRQIKRPAPGDVSVPSPPSSTGDGFNWGDASIGAGSVLGLVLLAGAAVFTVRRGRGTQLAGA
jgi:hypothetical protein